MFDENSDNSVPGLLYDQHDWQDDAAAVHDRLRRPGPAVRRATWPNGMAVHDITTYREARAAFTDPRLCKRADRLGAVMRDQLTRAGQDASISGLVTFPHMLNADGHNGADTGDAPADHTRLRKLAGAAFTPGRVAALRPRIEAITNDLLDAISDRGQPVDLIEEFAFPLPITVISEMLGIPDADRHLYRSWSADLMQDRQDVTDPASIDMAGHLAGVIAHKRAHPGDDLITSLIEANENGDQLSDSELIGSTSLFIVAGHETTTALIGNSVAALLQHPKQLAVLQDAPALWPNAVEELLRSQGPIAHATFRYTAEQVTIAGEDIPPGEIVMISPMAANHDPEKFRDPETFDITRSANGHLAFGHGIHHCLGAALARTETQIALSHVFARYPGMRLATAAEDFPWQPSPTIAGFGTLPVHLS